MRTRRSPTNQERLWKELGGARKPEPKPPVPLTDVQIDAMWWIPRTSRSQLKRDAARRRAERELDVNAYEEKCHPYRVRMTCGHLETRMMREATAGMPWTSDAVVDAPTAKCAACRNTTPRPPGHPEGGHE